MARRGAVRVSITGDASGLRRATRDAERNLGRLSTSGRNTDRNLSRAGGRSVIALGKVAGAAAAASAAYAGIAGARKAVETTSDLAATTISLNKTLNLSTERASQFAAVLKTRGVDTNQVSSAFSAFARNIDSAKRGTDRQADAFRALGVTQAELRKLSPEKLMGEVADGLKRMGPGLDRAAVETAVFGKGWKVLAPLLRGGKDAMNEQLNLAKKYGATFGGKTIQTMKDWRDAQRESEFAMMGLQVTFATTVVPVLTKGIRVVAEFVASLRSGNGTVGQFASVVTGVFARVRTVWTAMAALGRSNIQALGLSMRDLRSAGQALSNVFTAVLAVARTVWPGIRAVVHSAMRSIGGVIKLVSGILTGDFGQAWRGLKQIVSGTLGGIVGMIRAFTGPVRAAFGGVNAAIGRLISAGFNRLASTSRAVFGAFGSIVRGAARIFGNVVAGILRGFAKVFDMGSRLPGVGSKFKGLANTARTAAASVDRLGERSRDATRYSNRYGVSIKNLATAIRRIPKDQRIKIAAQVGFEAGRGGVLNFLSGGGGQGDGWGVPQTQRAVRKGGEEFAREELQKNKKRILDKLMGGLGGGAISGTGLNAFNRIAQRFGLTVGSGFRPGSITSSGNLSYHAMGRARDFPGSGPNMMRFARFMAGTYGRRLKELIYTPLGFSIKNGRRVAPYAQSGHYDHVHVAMRHGGRSSERTTKPTVHWGEEAPKHAEYYISTNPRDKQRSMGLLAQATREVVGMRRGGRLGGIRLAADAARKAGFRGRTLRLMTAIAGGESGYNTRAVGDGGWSKGLWQIYTRVHGWARRMNLFNPYVNARAAMKVYRSQGPGAWTIYKTGAYRSYMGAAARAIASLGRGGGGGEPRRPRRRERPRRGARSTFEGDLAAADLAIESAKGTRTTRDDIAAIGSKRGLMKGRRTKIRARLRKIDRALRGRLRKGTRARLLTERTTLLGELTSSMSDDRSLAEELGNFGGAVGAGEGGTTAADNSALEESNRLRAEQIAVQKQLIHLSQVQAPMVTASVVAMVNGSIGGRTGLAMQTPTVAGSVARY